jgi:hypothetical protein
MGLQVWLSRTHPSLFGHGVDCNAPSVRLVRLGSFGCRTQAVVAHRRRRLRAPRAAHERMGLAPRRSAMESDLCAGPASGTALGSGIPNAGGRGAAGRRLHHLARVWGPRRLAPQPRSRWRRSDPLARPPKEMAPEELPRLPLMQSLGDRVAPSRLLKRTSGAPLQQPDYRQEVRPRGLRQRVP